jgi:Kinesin motor domain
MPRSRFDKSLLNLLMVIDHLLFSSRNPTTHVPYKWSKLTCQLQDLLCSKIKTTIIAAISPVKDHLQETMFSYVAYIRLLEK